jgi:hypothetical protein
MEFKNPYWSNKLKMSALQRWIIVHSILYYEMDSSIVSDKMFDANARQLVKMQKQYSDEATQTDYWYAFYDFDGSTGFDLFGRLKNKDRRYLTQIAQHVLKLHKAGGKRNER